ncbi:hypothetical protein FNH21_16670, partial [Arthrobacter sp. KR32]|nr:hypothetical protein [Arthrobacter bussei]
GADLPARAVFANTAVDRIVPNQAEGQGLDVTVETFFEWVIDRTPFAGRAPEIPGATYVDDLAPYIEHGFRPAVACHARHARGRDRGCRRQHGPCQGARRRRTHPYRG